MGELITLLLIYGVIIFISNRSSNKNKRKNEQRVHRKVIYEQTTNKNGNKTSIKHTYVNGKLEEVLENGLSRNEYEQSILDEKREKLQEMNEFLENPININNNRHSYMYQDVEKEIIKVDHTFSKEVFLSKAKEIFLKYKNDVVKGEIQELKGYTTDEYMRNIQNKLEYNKRNNIKVVIENFHIYNAYLYGFSKSTDNQVITIKLKTDMRTYEINEETQYIVKGNKYATVDKNYEMQFTRKPKDIKCQSCGAPVNTKDLSVCEYCNTPIKVENNEWKLNYINILKD